MARKWFWPIVSGLLAVLAVVQVLSIRQESQTWDEAYEIASGYSYLKTGDYRISLEQPPLARVLSALPLLALHLTAHLDDESWRKSDERTFGSKFLYENRAPAGTILFWARMATILTTLCLGVVLALWTRAEFGAAAALFALALFAFDPNVIAYGRYVKSDILVTLLGLLTCASWMNYVRRGSWRSVALTGVLFGLAVGAKFSALFLLPVIVVLAAYRYWKQKDSGWSFRTAPQTAVAVSIVCAIGFGTTLLVYAPHAKLLVPTSRAERQADPSIRLLRDAVEAESATGQAMRWIGNRLGLRAHPLFIGVDLVARHSQEGHVTYLFGMYNTAGWWYYFPAAFAVKTPVATLLILMIALAASVGVRRTPGLPYAVALVSIAAFVTIAAANHINIGLRHLLPIYPFVFALLGAALARWRPRYAIAACALLAAESLAAYPNYLAFFNAAVGGPANGPRYLLDSNIDWGQDVLKLKSWMDAQGVKQICTCYFGTAEMRYYGIDWSNIPPTADRRAEADCYAAISVTPLYGLYVAPGDYQWLRGLTPVAKIGYSIYVYDLRKPPGTAGSR